MKILILDYSRSFQISAQKRLVENMRYAMYPTCNKTNDLSINDTMVSSKRMSFHNIDTQIWRSAETSLNVEWYFKKLSNGVQTTNVIIKIKIVLAVRLLVFPYAQKSAMF